MTTELEVTVATQKGFLSGGSPVIGMVISFCYLCLSVNQSTSHFQLKVALNESEISQQGLTSWYDLLPEIE